MNRTTKILLSALLCTALAAPGVTPAAHAAWGDILDRAIDRQKNKAQRETEKEVNETLDEAVDGTIKSVEGNKGEEPADSAPSKTGQDNGQGVTFTDSRGQKVHFPLGVASFADEVVSYRAGKGKIDKKVANPIGAVGTPDYREGRYDYTFVALGNGGNIVLKFTDNYLVDVPGIDLWVFEIGPAVESTNVAISKDGENWIHVGTVEGGTAGIDIAPKVQHGDRFSYVMLIDADGRRSPDGADIDAVGAIGSIARDATKEDSYSEATSKSDGCFDLRIEMNNGSTYIIGLDEIQSIITEPAKNNKQRLDLRITFANNESLLVDLSKVTRMIPVPAG